MNNAYSNYEWFIKQDFGNYSGKWLAIIDKAVVASGDNVNELINKAKKNYPNKKPLITKIKDKISIL